MVNGIKFPVVLLLAFLVTMWPGRTAEAFHSGSGAECKECHMGDGPALRGSDESSTCLRCHRAPRGARKPAGHYVATHDDDMRAGMPPLQLTPGGDFGYLKKTYSWTSSGKRQESSPGERHGHSIVAMDYGYSADTKIRTTPGGTFPSSELSCVSCHDPHGKIAKSVGAAGAYRLLGGIGYASGSAKGMAFTFAPPVAVAPRDYNRSEAVTDTRVAYGKGMSEWCSNCHARIGQDAGAASYGHPVGSRARFSRETLSNYNAYVKTGNLNGRGETSYTSLAPYEEGTDDQPVLAQRAKTDGSFTRGPDSGANVMCLTCHRAHASGWDQMTRWNMSAEFIVYKGVYPGTDNGAPAQHAQGRTAAETQKALYDRPPMLFAAYQRGLCNKCHAKD
jgi:hypothetical protein